MFSGVVAHMLQNEGVGMFTKIIATVSGGKVALKNDVCLATPLRFLKLPKFKERTKLLKLQNL